MSHAQAVGDWQANPPSAHIPIGRFTIVYAWTPYAAWGGVAGGWQEVDCPDGFDDSPEDQWLCYLHETNIVKYKWTDIEFIDAMLAALASNPFIAEEKAHET